jgi:hypothetical protein
MARFANYYRTRDGHVVRVAKMGPSLYQAYTHPPLVCSSLVLSSVIETEGWTRVQSTPDQRAADKLGAMHTALSEE